MNKRFGFETELYETLSCLPLAARHRLDTIGIKVHIKQWLAFDRNERLAICAAPADTEAELEALSEFVVNLIAERCGEEPTFLPPDQRIQAISLSRLPAYIAAQAGTLGYALDDERWETLDSDQRYALLKFGGDDRRRHKFAAAMREFFGSAELNVGVPTASAAQ